ncbi:MAG: T9SS type A sorting domain-containing protein [Candidatus Eiseniibacteriota bacterium]
MTTSSRMIHRGAAVVAALLIVAPGIAAHAQSTAPPATVHRLDDSAEERNREARDRWIDGLHRAAPGTDWRATERANAVLNQAARAAFLARPGGATQATATASWHEIGASGQTGRTHVAALATDGSLYVGTAAGGLWKGPIGGGSSWTPLSDNFSQGVHNMVVIPAASPNPEIIETITENGIIQYTINGGTTWVTPTGLPDAVWTGVRIVADQGVARRVFLLVEGWIWTGTEWDHNWHLLRSTDGGMSYTMVHEEPLATRPDIWMSRTGASALYLMVNGSMKKSVDGGVTFTLVGNAPVGAEGLSLVGSEAGSPTFYAVFLNAGVWTLYSSTNGGVLWSLKNTLPDFIYGSIGCSRVNSQQLVVGYVNVYASPDGGTTLNAINNWADYYTDPAHKLHADLHGVQPLIVSGTEHFYLSTDGGTFQYDFGSGAVLNLTQNGLRNAQYYSIFTSSSDASNIVAGSQDQGYQLSQAGAPPYTFSQAISGDYGHLTSAHTDHSMLWSVYPGFILLQTSASSSTPALEYPDFPSGATLQWMPFLLADPDNAAIVYLCGDHLYTVTRTGVGAYSYATSPQDFSGGIGDVLTALAISPADHQYWFAATANGVLWYSHNRGASWTQSGSAGPASHYFYGTAVLPSPTDRNTCFVGGSGYSGPAVYKSTDGGVNWNPLGASQPSTLVYKLAFDGPVTQKLYAATDAGPYAYDTGLDSWTNLLAATCCAPLTTYWDVEPLPSLGIMRFATYGRGIWDYNLGTVLASGTPQVETLRMAVYPNPSRESATFAFELPRAGRTRLEIFGVDGRRVANVYDAWRPAGHGEVRFDNRIQGRPLGAGIYLARISTPAGTANAKLLIAR